MKAKEARQFGTEIKMYLQEGQPEPAYSLMVNVLSEKTPFRLLDLIAEQIAGAPHIALREFLYMVSNGAYMGSWPIIGTVLRGQLADDLKETLQSAREFVVQADVWHGCDNIGERVLGPALESNFTPTLRLLKSWRNDPNRWPRRALGVGVHVWAKRSGGDIALTDRAAQLLEFLQPLFIELEMDTVKGIGWGLKTLGRYYPDLLSE